MLYVYNMKLMVKCKICFYDIKEVVEFIIYVIIEINIGWMKEFLMNVNKNRRELKRRKFKV